MELTLSNQSSTGFAHLFIANIRFTFKLPLKIPKGLQEITLFSLDGFTNEILVTPVENIFFRLCHRFWKYFLRYCLSDKTRFQRCAVFESGFDF